MLNTFAQDSERYASAIVEKIYSKVALLKTFPLSGRIVPEIGDETIRELIEGNYRVIYEVLSDQIVLIQMVRHSARNFKDFRTDI